MKIAVAVAVAVALALATPALAQVTAPGAVGPPPMGRAPNDALAPAPPPKRAEPASPRAPIPRGAVLEEVAGTVREIDRTTHRLSVETAAGPVTLSLDRNSMVYTANGLGTVLDLAPGQQIRAGRNADFLAYWVQLRAPARAPSPVPGTGPAGGAPSVEPSGRGGPPPEPPPGGVAPGGGPGGGPGGASGSSSTGTPPGAAPPPGR